MLQPALRSALEARYDLGAIRGAARLEGGERNLVLRLEYDAGLAVARISPPAPSAAGVAYEHALLRHMGARFPQVPAPLVGRDGASFFRHDGRVITLFPFMPGRIADRENAAVRAAAATMLGRLHRAALDYPDTAARPRLSPLRDLDWNRNPLWRWDQVEALLAGGPGALAGTPRQADPAARPALEAIAARAPQIARERGFFCEWVRQIAIAHPALLFAPIQGDYYRGNLLTEGDRISAVLDWDECRPEWLAWELARAIFEFCKDRGAHTLDEARAVAFLAAYRGAGGPVPPESSIC